MKSIREFGRLRAAVYLSILVAASAVWIVHAQQPPAGGAASNFTGGTVNTLKGEGRISYYVLGPGARTKWHTHEGGQLIMAEEGVGRTQIRGQAVRELKPGDSAWTPPGLAHWHGASPNASAKLYQIARGTTTWLEEVSDKDYTSAPKR